MAVGRERYLMANMASMWYGSPLGSLEKITINSYLKNGHSFTLYLYDMSTEVPDGITVKDANTVLDSSRVFGENGRWQCFSDLFRYKLLMETDYIWVDMDAVCLRPDWNFPEYIFGWEYPEGQFRYMNNAVLKFPKDSEALRYIYERADSYDISQIDFYTERGCPTNMASDLLDETIDKFNLVKYGQEEAVFHPVPEANWYISEDEDTIQKVKDLTKDSHAAHISRSMLDSLSIPKNSYLGQLADFYGVSVE